jgi:DNA uptake protein ComE-like DNA-binding protein
MLRRTFTGLVILALIVIAASGSAQKLIDINSAPESEIAAVGIEKTVAKKIVESRPFNSKRDLLTRQFLTMEQYDKVKDLIVARQPPQK